MNENNETYYTIDILEMLKAFWNYKLIIVLFMMAAVVLSVINIKFFTEETYTASGTIYVSSRAQVKDDSGDVQKSDIDTARTLSTTYIETLKIRSFLMDVSRDVGGKYSWNEIKDMMAISPINDTELLSIKVTANSAGDAYRIAKSILKLAPDKLADVTEGGSIKVIDEVLRPSSPNSKNEARNIAVSAFVGIVLAAAIIVVITLLDKKVRKSEDIEKRYNVPILGVLDN